MTIPTAIPAAVPASTAGLGAARPDPARTTRRARYVRVSAAALGLGLAAVLNGCGSSQPPASTAESSSAGVARSAPHTAASPTVRPGVSGSPAVVSGYAKDSAEYAALSFASTYSDGSLLVIVDKRLTPSGLTEIAVHYTGPARKAVTVQYWALQLSDDRGAWQVTRDIEYYSGEDQGFADPLTAAFGS